MKIINKILNTKKGLICLVTFIIIVTGVAIMYAQYQHINENEQIKKQVNELIAKADDYAKKEDYDNAVNELESAQLDSGRQGLEDINQQVKTKLSEYTAKKDAIDKDADEKQKAMDKDAQEQQKAADEENAKVNLKSQSPQIGMTECQVLGSAWGKPEHVNRTTTASGTSEQWCYYGDRYVYLENGIVTSIQD